MAQKDTLRGILNRFGFATVFNPKFYVWDKEADGDYTTKTPKVELDSLTVANITQEGPTKTIKGGLYAETLLRYGKEMRLEMENALGTAAAMEHLLGGYFSDDDNTLQITDDFAVPMYIEGETFVIDAETGKKEWVTIVFHKFLPDSIFEVTMEAEGDFGTFNLAGDLIPNKCGVFYEIRKRDAAPDGCDERDRGYGEGEGEGE